jgi:2,3-bisphosphoglycerate-dependent phosphoglycerate mutase
MILYIIRHAQSVNNALIDQRQRVSDPPLTELGCRQAELLAEHLSSGTSLELSIGESEEDTTTYGRRGYGISRLYCSAMTRSLETAQPIGRALDLRPEVWLEIHEHGGIYLEHEDERGVVGYPGKSRSEILADFPDYILPETITEEGWWRGGQEDWPGCHARALKVAAELLRRTATDERIAMVSHGGFIDALLKTLLNQLPSRQAFFSHFNTAISRLEFHPDGFLEIRYLNRIGHLPAELIS